MGTSLGHHDRIPSLDNTTVLDRTPVSIKDNKFKVKGSHSVVL